MHSFLRLASGLFLALALMGASGCATAPALSPTQVAAVRSGEQSAIIMSYRAYETMFWAKVFFENVATGETYTVSMWSGSEWRSGDLGIVAIPPGRYRVDGGDLNSGSSTAALPLLSYWFDTFEIGAGEIVDLGILTLDDVDVRATATMGDHLARIIEDGNLAGRDTYLAYSIEYADEEDIRQRLAATHPELGVTPIRRPLRMLLDQAQFRRAVADAYSPNADGTPPTVAEANGRVRAALNRLLRDRPHAVGSPK